MKTILIAAHAETQLSTFLRNNNLSRKDFRRVMSSDELYGHRETVLVLLPAWRDSFSRARDAEAYCRERNISTVEVSEDTVLGRAPKPCPNDANANGDCHKCRNLSDGCPWPKAL